MKRLFFVLGLILKFSSFAFAVEPTEIDGAISIVVERSKENWVVTVLNGSEDDIEYEMMGKVPRGLGLEFWENGRGERVHAEDLAKFLNVDGFPADLRTIKAHSSQTFALNPKSMSAVSPKVLQRWNKLERSGRYTCRVFFGGYASRLFSVDRK